MRSGVHARARAGEIKEFTGVSAPCEAPEKPEIELHTDKLAVTESVARIMEYLHFAEPEARVEIRTRAGAGHGGPGLATPIHANAGLSVKASREARAGWLRWLEGAASAAIRRLL